MLYAMFSMVVLTFFVGLLAVKVRFNSVSSGTVKAKFYRLMQGQDVPELVTKTTRSFNNFFETPVLFYVVGSLYLTLNIESSFAVVVAWLFVLFRCIHVYIHLTYNHILHRLLVFWCAFLCILILWINLIIRY